MRSIIITAILVFVLGLGAYYLYNHQQYSTETTWEGDFAVKNIGDVNRIVITNKKGLYTNLQKQEDGDWTINETYKASKSSINLILNVLENLQIQSVPSPNANEHIFNYIESDGLHVRVLDENEEIIRSFYFGPVTQDAYGVYAVMDGSKKPFVLEHESSIMTVSHPFSLKPEELRDQTLLSFQDSEILKVSMHYPDNIAESFVLTHEGGTFSVKPYDSSIPVAPSELLEKNAETFLRGFDFFHAEGFSNRNSHADQIRKAAPFLILMITDVRGNENTYTFVDYRSIHEGEEEFEKRTVKNRFYVLHDEDIYLIQHLPVKEILRGYSYFFLK